MKLMLNEKSKKCDEHTSPVSTKPLTTIELQENPLEPFTVWDEERMGDDNEGSTDQCHDRHRESCELTNGRPLKKAKYAWQVKGGPSRGSASHSNYDSEIVSDGTPSVAITLNVDDRLRAVALNDKRIVTVSQPSSSVSSLSSFSLQISDDSRPNLEFDNNAVVQPTHSLKRWQSKQMAQGIIDNAINNVLGDMGGIESFHANGGYDVAATAAYNRVHPSTWGNYLSAQNIENEGVAEAIRQQGLQRRNHIQLSNECASSSNSEFQNSTSQLRNKSILNGHTSQNTSSSIKPMPTSSCANVSVVHFEQTKLSDCEVQVSRNVVQLESEELLTKAVTCAISHKGLGVLAINP